jgi:hypothetical protein
MTISLATGKSTEEEENAKYGHGGDFRPKRLADELEETLRLARHLTERLSMPAGEQVQGVRMRLVRAHALSIVDLLTDIMSDRGAR